MKEYFGKLPTRRVQLLVSFGLLVFLTVAGSSLALLTRSKFIARWTLENRQHINRFQKTRFRYENYFQDFEDRLIYGELPSADYSKGGVYLMGTSNLKWATRLWELPEPQRSLIRNYGIGATSHQFQFHFLQYLVEHEGLLKAGGDKNMIVFGLSWHAVGPKYSPDEYFPQLLKRHGQFSYDVTTGITPFTTNPFFRAVHFERVRIMGLLRTTASIFAHSLGYGRVRNLDPEGYIRSRASWSGTEWDSRMEQQLTIFEAVVVYLQDRGVKVNVVLLPQGSWEDKMPYQSKYVATLLPICQRHSVKVIDWSRVLDDEDFADSNHPNPSGVDKLNPKFIELALDFLRSTGEINGR